LKAWIDLSTFCNAACPQCHRTDPSGLDKIGWLPLVQWSLESFKEYFPPESLSHYERFELCGTWGDPMMNKDIYEIVEYLITTDPFVKVHINTNAGMRDPDWWWKFGMMGGKRLEIVFDVDGINQEMHAKYRRKVDFNRMKDNIEAFCTTPAFTMLMTIVFKHNEDYVEDIEKMCRGWGIVGPHFVVPSNRFSKGKIFEFITPEGEVDRLEKADV